MTPSVASAAHQIPIRFPELADREPRGMVARSLAEVLGLGPKHLSRAELLELLRKAKAESGRDWLLFLVTSGTACGPAKRSVSRPTISSTANSLCAGCSARAVVGRAYELSREGPVDEADAF